MTAIQTYFIQHNHYGIYAGVGISDGQVIVNNESYDVSASLFDTQGQPARRILIPIKTRETEGGGHSHLFSRDILSAIQTARYDSASDYLAVIIVARHWSHREAEKLREVVDHLAIFDLAPSEFNRFSDEEQGRFNQFVASVLEGSISPKKFIEVT